MITRDAMAHSPSTWGLYGAAAAFAVVTVLTVGWNLWEDRHRIADALRI